MISAFGEKYQAGNRYRSCFQGKRGGVSQSHVRDMLVSHHMLDKKELPYPMVPSPCPYFIGRETEIASTNIHWWINEWMNESHVKTEGNTCQALGQRVRSGSEQSCLVRWLSLCSADLCGCWSLVTGHWSWGGRCLQSDPMSRAQSLLPRNPWMASKDKRWPFHVINEIQLTLHISMVSPLWIHPTLDKEYLKQNNKCQYTILKLQKIQYNKYLQSIYIVSGIVCNLETI